MSEYSKESGLYDGENKKVIGKFKDESPDEVIESFVGIRSKCYTFKTKNNVVKKAKGVSKVVVKKKISFDDYKITLWHKTSSPYQTRTTKEFGLIKPHQEHTDTFAIKNR